MKAIFIDGASLWHMGRALHIRINYHALYDILTKHVGSKQQCLPPVITIHPDMEPILGKPLRISGYEVVSIASTNSQDDTALKKRIAALDASVDEIVIVSSDADFIPELRQKQAAGARIIWVASRFRDPDSGKGPLGTAVDYFIGRGEFEFVELRRFRQELLLERPVGTPGGQIVIQCKDERQLARIIADLIGPIEKVVQTYPGVQFSVEKFEDD